MGDKYFKKSNSLIYASSNGTLLENQLFAIGLQIISISETNQVVSTIYSKEISDSLGIQSDSILPRIEKLCDRSIDEGSFWEWTVSIKNMGNDRDAMLKVVDDAIYKDGVLRIIYNSGITELIVNLEHDYTVLSFSEAMSLRTIYSYRLYEILKAGYDEQAHRKKYTGGCPIEYAPKELELMLGVMDFEMPQEALTSGKACQDILKIAADEDVGKYSHEYYCQFDKMIIKKAVCEINEKTSLRVDYFERQEGNMVTGIEFFVDMV